MPSSRREGRRRLETAGGTLVAPEVDVARGFWRRFRGLMLRAELPEGRGLVLSRCRSIHMLFMRFPIDVAFLDGEGRVVRILAAIRPWRISPMVRRARTAVELPAGTLERAGVREGDVLTLR